LPKDAVFDIDTDMESEEDRPHFDTAKGTWHLVVKRPLVGYRYRLRWPTPGKAPDEPVPGETIQWRELLLAMADRNEASPADMRAQHVFGLLADEFEKRLSWGGANEVWSVEFFVYDSAKLALRPVAHRGSSPPHPNWRGFSMPLGDGIAGAAFQRRSTVPWAKQNLVTTFIKPLPDPNAGVELRNILAVPIYHPIEQDKSRPSPWGTIGVVAFGSASTASKIAPLLNPELSPEAQDMLKILRALGQAHVYDMVTALGQRET
jgi:hypothetical protein